MPDFRSGAINAYRDHFSELKNLSDNDIWRVIGINDPELAQGLVKSQETPSVNRNPGIIESLFGHLGVQKSDPATPIAGSSPTGAPIINPMQPSVASEGAAQSLAGMGKFVAGIPGAVKSGAELALGGNTQKQLQTLVDAVKAIAGGAKTGAGMVTNPPPPESPQWQQAQQATGANLIASELPNAASGAIQGGGALIDAVKSRIPSTARAGANLQAIKNAAGNIPIDTTQIDPILERAQELNATGNGPPPDVIKKLSKRLADTTGKFAGVKVQMAADPIPFGEGSDFGTAAGRLSASERMATKPMMERQVAQLAKALREANRGAAAQAGLGDAYDSAIAEYRSAARIADAQESIIKAVKKYGIKAAIGAGLSYEAYRGLTR